MTDPGGIIARLEAIDHDLAMRQLQYEEAARRWYTAKRDKEKRRAEEFLKAEGTVAERQAQADVTTSLDGRLEEAEYEALKAVIRVLETRASIGQSLLRTQRVMEGVG